MTLEELHAAQHKDMDAYQAARDKYWQDLRAGHEQIAEACGGKDHVPDSIKEQMEKEIVNYQQEWTMYTGERHKALTETHKKQREEITGNAKYEAPKKAEKKNPLSDEQQQKLQKIIAQQQAIRKTHEKKRSR